MTTGTWTLACLLWTVAALPPDVVPMNEPNFQIPVRIDEARRQEVREMILFVSRDEGKTWNQEGLTTPENPTFNFIAQKNGTYWFLVTVVDRTGKKDPASPSEGQVSQKILVDTAKPELRAFADRQGEDVVVRWEVREDYPDLATLKLDYRPSDSPEAWQTVAVSKTATGQATFRPGFAGDMQVRMQMKDLAGNLGFSEAKIPGGLGGTAGSTVSRPSGPAPVGPIPSPAPPPGPTGGVPPPPGPGGGAPLPLPPAPGGDKPWAPVGSGAPAPLPLESARSPQPGSREWEPPRGAVSPVQHIPTGGSGKTTIADTSGQRVPDENPAGSGTGTPRPTVPQLPTLQVINALKVPIEYQISKFGPSGVKFVDVYLTQDDGRTWALYGSTESTDQALVPDAKPEPLTQTRTLAVELPREGLYGFYLVPKSGAGLSKPPPQPGTLPQLRVEVDLTPPTAEMYRPEADPAKRDCLVLSWRAQDRNLTARPIKLEWAERKDQGRWDVIGDGDLANTGRFTWQVPRGLPPRVFLRLTVRDSGGNVSVAETPDPILVDLNEPIVEAVKVGGQH